MSENPAPPPASSGEVGEMVERLRSRDAIAECSPGKAIALCEQAADLLARVARERDEAREALGKVARAYDRSYAPGSLERSLGDAARAALAAMEGKG